MTRPILTLLLIALLGCTDQASMKPKEETDVLERLATLHFDNLPADGCNAYLQLESPSQTVDTRTYFRLPTQATRPLMDKAIDEVIKSGNGVGMGGKPVTIRYRETDQTVPLSCGWGVTLSVKAIELLAIKQ